MPIFDGPPTAVPVTNIFDPNGIFDTLPPPPNPLILAAEAEIHGTESQAEFHDTEASLSGGR